MSVRPRLRFEIFKRDGFRCVYCGATPLTRPLTADHVVPVSRGGEDSPANLVTACSECNGGKAAVPLDRKALEASVATPADKDHARQILEYLKIQREVEAARKAAVDAIAVRWEEVVGPLSQQMYSHLRSVIVSWSLDKIEDAMQITAAKMGTVGEEFEPYMATKQSRYFHGILRRWREEKRANHEPHP